MAINCKENVCSNLFPFQFYQTAEKLLNKAIQEKGENQKIEFPQTAFSYPLIYALLGQEIKTLKDLKPVLGKAKSLLDNASDCLSALLTQEIIMGLRYLDGLEPQENCLGFIPDSTLRSFGLKLIDSRTPALAVILGSAPDSKTALEIVSQLQEKEILTLLAGSVIDQLEKEAFKSGWETSVVPLGRDPSAGIYAFNWIIRFALTFGGCQKKQWSECLKYLQDYLPVFCLALGDDLKDMSRAIALGFPLISDISETDAKKIVPVSLQTAGIKLKTAKLSFPYDDSFTGEIICPKNLYTEFKPINFDQTKQKEIRTPVFEYLKMCLLDEIEDGKVEIRGLDLDLFDESNFSLGIYVKIAGRKMQKDFEPILERQIHRYINKIHGISHHGSRQMIEIRISKEAFDAGFRLRHLGEGIRAGILEEFSAIVDKVEVIIYTNQEDVQRILEKEVLPAYEKRDRRTAGMTDESVDTFYTCTICQSCTPDHVCLLTPERTGLCGAYNWLDAKVSCGIKPLGGPNLPVLKSKAIDLVKGQWESVNELVFRLSNKTVQHVNLYSMLENPMTSCSYFECMAVVVPEANGVMIVNRFYSGMTPCGMSFSTLAEIVCRGKQTAGFMGIARSYITSPKFISADGGLHRLVWMPKELKELLRETIEKRANELGITGFVDKIADETITVEPNSLLAYLKKVKHPVLTMPEMLLQV